MDGYNPSNMTGVWFIGVLAGAGLGGYALLTALGLDDDEAWAAGRMAGLAAVGLVSWWAGVAGLEAWRALGAMLLAIGAAAGLWRLWRRRPPAAALLRGEAVFLGVALVVLLMRLDRPEILHQEKLMDQGILATLLRAQGFPPPDMWLAGMTLPYYYLGALLWAVPIAAAGLRLEIAYNLVVPAVAGLTAAAAWALGRRLSGRAWGGLLAAFVAVLAGTFDGLRQLLAGTAPWAVDLWASSRQVTDTITEYPLFSFWLGDLHPHVLSMPLAGLTWLLAHEVGRRGPTVSGTAAVAASFGLCWAANPWSMPPTLVGASLLLLSADGRWRWPWGGGGRRWLAVVAVAAAGWAAAAPFHLRFDPPYDGIGVVHAWTPPIELLLWGGALLIPAAAAALREIAGWGGGEAERRTAIAWIAVAVALVAAAASGRPTLVLLLAVGGVLAWAAVRPGEDPWRPTMALAAAGTLLLAVPEVVFVVDGYGEALHRMNTVFKSYIQAWALLAVALPALVVLGTPGRVGRAVLLGIVLLACLPHLGSALLRTGSSDGPLSLDGIAWMSAGDRAMVRALREQPHGTTLIEAVGPAYSEHARLSSASGVPAYLGWANHEMVWRGGDIGTETARREALVDELYRCGRPDRVRELAAEAGVDLVAIGTLERRSFPLESLAAVAEAGEVVLDAHGARLVRFGGGGG